MRRVCDYWVVVETLATLLPRPGKREAYMNSEKSNLLKMAAGTIATTFFFVAMGLFVSFCLPEDGGDAAGWEVQSACEPSVSEDDVLAAAGQEEPEDDAIELHLDAVKGGDLGLVPGAAETNVGGSMDFASYEPVDDTELSLYRNQDTKSYVEWFYTQVTGSREIALAVLDAASQFNVSPSLAFALAYTESKYKPDATHTNVNGSIDRGLFQLNSYSFPNLTEEQFFDAATSAYYGMSHLSYCLEVSSTQIAGLAKYNAGRGKVEGDRTPQSTLNYIAKILDYQKKLDSNFSTEILAFYSDGNGLSTGRYLAKY